LLAGAAGAWAQGNELAKAEEFAANGDYKHAGEIYEVLYKANPDALYGEYMEMLLKAKEYKEAEALVDEQMQHHQRDAQLMVDMGHVYEAAGKNKKAEEQYNATLQLINGDDAVTTRMANAFLNVNRSDYAVQTYERATKLLGNPYMYSMQLAKLYAKAGDLDKAVNALLDGNPAQYMDVENVKATLLELLGDDPKKLQQAQKALIKKINGAPENIYYAELLTWLYTQKNDWDGALIQIIAIDERNKEGGQRLVAFAQKAIAAKQYDVAVKAYDEVIEKGKEQQFYVIAKADRLIAKLKKLEDNPAYTQEEAQQLAAEYDAFLNEVPGYYGTPTVQDYAKLEAQYMNNPQKGIDILEKAIVQGEIKREVRGRDKLQLGDYYVLTGRVWDASLLYSQVDKDFKEDMLGEEARFKNAKLAYYRGDFTWAQQQLSVLKASTSELIANDALYLSVLITENVTEDSNYVPLTRFAYADLLLFQNKDKEAETLLDSISAAFPQHPLNDDILMLRARIAEKHRDYDKALGYLRTIYEKYGKDVLGDDAVYETAVIYEKYLHKNDEAKKYYEQLVIDYPGSTFVQEARRKASELGQAPNP
jgi:tetratricopeptide (TPR) repeat protein